MVSVEDEFQYVVLKVRYLKVTAFRMARWLSWLERRPVTAEVVGSNPIRVVYLNSSFGIIAQLGEHLPYKQGVTGSSPVGPISYAFSILKIWMGSRVAKGGRL